MWATNKRETADRMVSAEVFDDGAARRLVADHRLASLECPATAPIVDAPSDK